MDVRIKMCERPISSLTDMMPAYTRTAPAPPQAKKKKRFLFPSVLRHNARGRSHQRGESAATVSPIDAGAPAATRDVWR